jgi:hypothetical protein
MLFSSRCYTYTSQISLDFSISQAEAIFDGLRENQGSGFTGVLLRTSKNHCP